MRVYSLFVLFFVTMVQVSFCAETNGVSPLALCFWLVGLEMLHIASGCL